jgi:hypothetical protein
VHQRADRSKPRHRLLEIPDQHIEIVAAFRQDHRAGETFVAPVAAHEAVRHVPVGDILTMLDGDEIADHARFEHLVQLTPEGGVAQHVADLQHTPRALRRLHKLDGAFERVRHRLFEQHVVAGFHRRNRRADVHLILRGDDGAVGQLPGGDQILPGREAAAVVDVVRIGQPLAADRVRFSNADDAHFVGMAQGVGCVGRSPAPTSADDDHFNRFGHRAPRKKKNLSIAQSLNHRD